jgi:4-hydroxy-L-threonine phosphate dehydrogenase PdxA
MLPRIALAIGDPAGVGPELACRLLADPATLARAEIHLIASEDALRRGADATGVPMPQAGPRLRILDWPSWNARFQPSEARADNGRFILDSLALGADMVRAGEADAFCFGPLNKGAMRLGGMTDADDMRWFARHLEHRGTCGELSVLGSLWTARVTSHVALKDVASLLTPRKIADAIRMLTDALRASGLEQPRIGVCGLNPHNGDNGSYGDEEGRIIEPGIRLAASEGYETLGPYPADTIFVRATKGHLDGIVTMYHDQGQIATKLLGFDVGVTVLGGLPMAVTTPAHGTAYDIVGRGVASPASMASALDLACRMGANRQARQG